MPAPADIGESSSKPLRVQEDTLLPQALTIDVERGDPMPASQEKVAEHNPKRLNRRRGVLDWLSNRKDTKPATGHHEQHILDPYQENPHVPLIQGYGSGNNPMIKAFQPRRTLDQYFYSHLGNTAERDSDQVVFRYTKNQTQPKLFMVDQLWLWVLNGGKQSKLPVWYV